MSQEEAEVSVPVEGGAAGEALSKNAQKKLLKAQEAAKKKAEKDAEKAAKKAAEPVKEGSHNNEETEELDPTQYYENRVRAIETLEVSTCNYKLTISVSNIIFLHIE